MRRARGRMAKLACFALIIGAGVILNATSAGAAACAAPDVSWVGPPGGSWNVVSNWDTGALPQNGDDVCIDTTLPGSVYTFPSGSVSLNSIDMPDDADHLSIESGFFGLSSASTVGNLDLVEATATLDVDGALEVRDTFTWNEGTLQGSANTQAVSVVFWSNELADCECATPPRYLNDHDLSMSGTGSQWNGWGAIVGTGSSTITNSGTLTIRGDGDIARELGGTDRIDLVNTGTIVKDVGATGSPDDNSVWDVDADFQSGSELMIERDMMTFTGPSTFAGAITLDAPPSSAQLRFNASGPGVTHSIGGSLETLGAGSVSFESGTSTVTGTYDSWDTTVDDLGSVSFDNEGSPAVVRGLLSVLGGTLTGDGDVTLGSGAFFQWSDGTISGSGELDATPGATGLFGGLKTLDGRTLEIDGFIEWGTAGSPTGDIAMGNGAELITHDQFFMRTDADITAFGTPSSITNHGQFAKTNGSGVTEIQVPITNDATDSIEGIQANAGTLELSGGASSTGPMQANNSATLELSGGGFDVSGTMSGTGTVHISGGDVDISNLPAANWAVEGLTMLSGGSLQTFLQTDQLAGETAEFEMSGGTLSGSPITTLRVTGDASITGGTIDSGVWEFDGNTTLAPIGSMNISGGELWFDGNTQWTSGDIHTADAFFHNNGTFSITGDDDVQDLAGFALSEFANAGTLIKTAGADGESTNLDALRIENHPDALGERLEVADGVLKLGAGGDSSGPVVVQPGATLDFAGGNFGLQGGATGTGTLHVNNGSLDIGDDMVTPFDFPGTLRISGPSVSVFDDSGVANLTLEGGILTGAATMTVEQALDWSGGTMGGTGDTVLLDGVPEFDHAISDHVELFGRTLTNEGGLTWSGGDIDTGTEGGLIRNTGTFTLGPGAGSLLYSGAAGGEPVVSIEDGKLEGNGTIQGTLQLSGGIVAPGGSVGTLQADVYAQSGGTLEMEVDSTLSADLLTAVNSATLGGSLHVDVNFTPVDAFSVGLVDGDPPSGQFADVVVDGLPAGWQSSVEVTATEVLLHAQPPPNARTVTLNTSATTRTFGQSFRLSGKVSSAEPACVNGVPVKITRDVLGGAVSFSNVATVAADADGDYTLSRTADRGAVYKATVAATVDCTFATATKTVKVKKKVTLTGPRKVAKGTVAKLKATVAPCSGHQRQKVTLQRKTASGFKKVATKATSSRCIAVFKVVMTRTRVFRVVAPKTDADHLAGTSALKRVRAV